MADSSVDLLNLVEKYIKENRVMIFSKSYCPFCVKVKQLFNSLGVEFNAIELDHLENGSELQSAMAKIAGRSSVPQVFINGERVGGCDDTMAAHSSGQLQSLLAVNN